MNWNPGVIAASLELGLPTEVVAVRKLEIVGDSFFCETLLAHSDLEHFYTYDIIESPYRIVQSGRPLQCTPLYQTLLDKGAVFGQIGGCERAFWFDLKGINKPELLSFRNIEPWYDAVKRECEVVRDGVGVMDHGGFTRFEVEGPGVTQYLDRVFCGKLPQPGRVKLSYLLTPKGRIWSEATIARLDENRYLLCGPTLADLCDHDWLRDRAGLYIYRC